MAYESGIDKIKAGRCPRGALLPIACTFCQCGHMLECHHPLTCEQAKCSHYQAAIDPEEQQPFDDGDITEDNQI